MKQDEQQFLNDLDKHLWTMADKLRANVDAAVYKHVVLGLIFLKYVSDAFRERHAELEVNFRDPKHDYYLGDDAEELIAGELKTRDYYTEKFVRSRHDQPYSIRLCWHPPSRNRSADHDSFSGCQR